MLLSLKLRLTRVKSRDASTSKNGFICLQKVKKVARAAMLVVAFSIPNASQLQILSKTSLLLHVLLYRKSGFLLVKKVGDWVFFIDQKQRGVIKYQFQNLDSNFLIRCKKNPTPVKSRFGPLEAPPPVTQVAQNNCQSLNLGYFDACKMFT